jgi:branched-chain amino acid transport system substrate-binding protein
MFRKCKLASALVLALYGQAFAANAPGVTATEIKIGGIFPFSGPVSSIGRVGEAIVAYVHSINDRGGINGRKISYIADDDAYSPPKAVEQVRKLVESDKVAFIFSQLGTPGNTAAAKYLAVNGVPSIALLSASKKFTNVDDFPLSTTALVSADTEGRIYAKYLANVLPNARYAILYQNDDLGKDYVNAFKAFFKSDFDEKVITASYEVTDPTIDSQVVTLKSSGAGGLLIAGTPRFAAQAIRKVAEIGWKPTLIVNFPSSSVSATLRPAGLDNAVGVIAGTFIKDPTDSKWDDDAGMKGYRTFFAKYLPGADIGDVNYVSGYQQGLILEQLLRQCGDDLSRENIVRQARNITNFVLPTAMPGIAINTSPTSNMVWTQLQLQRWNGSHWEQFGEVLKSE